MTEPDALFAVDHEPAKPVEKLSAGRRLTLRQADRIRRGIHPLGDWLLLHADARRDATADDERGLPLTCGTCAFIDNYGPYLKCTFDDRARYTHGPASDLRRWWPACRDYKEATR